MTSAQLKTAESIAVFLADGTAYIYPPAAPIVAAFERLLEEADQHGVIPTQISAEQAREMAAGMAAARASAVTSYKEHRK